MMGTDSGRVPEGTGLSQQAAESEVSALSGFDPSRLDTIMLGRFVAQYEEGAHGFFVDADEAQEVARQVKTALSLGEAIMNEIDTDLSIPTEVACRVFRAIKRANAIATETRRAETTGSVADEGAGPQDIAHD